MVTTALFCFLYYLLFWNILSNSPMYDEPEVSIPVTLKNIQQRYIQYIK